MKTRLTISRLCLVLSLTLGMSSISAFSAEPLAPRIDQLMEAGLIGPAAPVASDADFLRRISLDLIGILPSSAEARAFLDDPAPNKRELLVNRLLDHPRHPVHMSSVFDVMLMERRADKHVTTPEWQKFLQESFRTNKPYDQLAREILSADGTDPNLRPASKFLLDRDAEPNLVTRDVGRVFFGMDLQCAQCHDHPLVDHYLQSDYFGLFAFVNRTVVFADAAQKKSFLGEKAEGDASFKSVFTGDAASTRPQLPGATEIDEPRFRQGDDYVAAPAATVRPIPKYSRRAKLAELATNGQNRQFNLNITNRFWALVMGRGLVHPVDLHHPDNPPANPAVLDLVTNEFVAMKYDMRWLLRELVLTKTYQRSIDPPVEVAPQLAAATQQAPAVEAEVAKLKEAAVASRKLSDTAREELKTARKTLEPAEAAWQTAEKAVAAAKKPVDDASAAIAKTQGEAAAKQTAITAIGEATAKSTEVAKLLPGDKEVAAAVATFTAKQAQLTTELAALQKKVEEQTAARQALMPKLEETQVAADAAFAQFAEARKPVDAAKGKFIGQWNQHKADFAVMSVQKQRLDQLKVHLDFQAALASVTTTQAAIDPAKAELTTAVQAVEQQQAEVTKQTALVAETEKVMEEANKALADAKTQFTTKQTVVLAVAEAISKTDAALQKLPGDAELTLAVQKLKERHEPLTKEAITLEQAMATKDASAKDVATKLGTMKQTLVAATTEMTVRQQTVTAKTNAVNQTAANAQTAQGAVASGRSGLIDRWTNGFGVRAVKQLTPEQLAWAMMQATGVVEPQFPGADAEIEKTLPKANVASDPAQAKLREFKVASQINEIMRGNVSLFTGLYGGSAGQPQDDFYASADQALFAANGTAVVGWASGGLLIGRLMPLTEPKAIAEEIYLSVLTRRPTDAEVAETTQQLTARAAEKPAALRDLIWALVTSAEFRFNH